MSAGLRLGCCVARPSKIVCIGLNYSDHARETGASPPTEPIIFLKATTALCGPNDDTVLPKGSEKTDWEVELAVVIGKKASYVSEADALDHVAGYCLHNDLSEWAFQLERLGTWDKGKGCDSFAPLGPWLATREEIADVHTLRLWLTVNGEKMQDGSTANLIFKLPQLIAYVSRFMTLPEPVYVKAGDVIEPGIDGLGTSRQVARNYSDLRGFSRGLSLGTTARP